MSLVTIIAQGGAQQTAISAAFRKAGWEVRGTRRDPAPGDGALKADPESGDGLDAALAGADVVVLTLPQDHRPGAMERIAHGVAQAAAQAGVGRIVLNVAGRIEDHSPAAVYGGLRAARAAVTEGLVPAVVLQPTSYMDNLLAPWSLPAIAGGTLAYPVAETTRIAWISHATLALAVVAAATADVAGQAIDIGGAPLSGADLAATLSARLGHPVAYVEIPLASFAAGLNASFGPPAGDRIAELYAHLAANPRAMEGGTDGLRALGVEPETFADFAARSHWA